MSDDTKDQTFPSWRYGPNDESAIFNSADEVPEGWEDHPSKVGETIVYQRAPSAPASDEKAERAEIIASLKELKVPFFPGATTEALKAKLEEATKPA